MFCNRMNKSYLCRPNIQIRLMGISKIYANHYKALLSLGLPIVVGQLGMIVMSFADTIMVGHHSTEELAAASFVNNMFNLVIIFSTGFSYGLTPLVGRLFGSGDREGAGRLLRNGLFANGTVAVLVTFLMWLLYVNIHRLGQPDDLLPLMRPYYVVLLFSLLFVLLFNAFRQFMDGITDTKTSMWIMLGGNVFNIVVNWILIYGKAGFPEMGLLGAGISTLASRILMLLAAIAVFSFGRRYRVYRKGFTESRVNAQDFRQLNRLGWPVGLQMGMETASFSLSTIMVGWLGTSALAAHQIMLTIGQLGYMVYYGMAAAVAVRVSNFYGQNDAANIRRSANAGFHIIMAMACAVSVLCLSMGNEIGGWFTDSGEVISMVAALMLPFVVYQFGDGLQCNFSNALRGTTDVKPVMLYAFIAFFIISLPAGYLFGFVFDWGLTGIWFSFPFGLTSAGIMYYLRFRSGVARMDAKQKTECSIRA